MKRYTFGGRFLETSGLHCPTQPLRMHLRAVSCTSLLAVSLQGSLRSSYATRPAAGQLTCSSLVSASDAASAAWCFSLVLDTENLASPAHRPQKFVKICILSAYCCKTSLSDARPVPGEEPAPGT